ncbi:hypothetical protein QBZ16_002411 [Prototheca wickerhamii]|uniref:Oxidation resistance protein 1 n=1 Tax=Prototheca wickerhamii TaxID=3111 RepID=A0AAD9IK91_PROWI|nr:hypothetical protein QBZ16_002411 [Prototheca wickerhamii]
MLSRIIGGALLLFGMRHAGSVDPERLKGLSSPPEEGDSPDSDGGLGGLWRHIPFLPGLVEAIVGTPYDEDEDEEEEDLRRWHHVSSQAGETSAALLAPGDAALLTALCPSRFHYSRWHLAYSTLRDGISMQSLLRRAHGKSPTFLLVRDMQRNVFGAYCSEAWKLSKRFYGTGETFVFRLGSEKASAKARVEVVEEFDIGSVELWWLK